MDSPHPSIIIGSNGQDGRLLTDLLRALGQRVIGVTRDSLDILNGLAVEQFIADAAPAKLYYLAADHGSSSRSSSGRSTDASPLDPAAAAQRAWDVHVTGLINVCQAMRQHAPVARLFYASSSRVFGDAEMAAVDVDGAHVVDENTPFRPLDLYGITKAAGMGICAMYRGQHGLFCSSGILFNHESSMRGESFVTQRLARAAAAIAAGKLDHIKVGRLAARTDWGWAPQYVAAMTQILDAPIADDFVVATGRTHSVQQFAEAAFNAAGLNWRDHVSEDSAMVGSARAALAGNPAKLRAVTGWHATMSLGDIAREMVATARLP